jgi:hypothetical protein
MSIQNAIEDKISGVLNGDSQKNAISFVEFLRSNGLSPEAHESGAGWSIERNGDDVGFVLVNGDPLAPGPWTIWFNSCDFNENGPVDDCIKETAWAHASICGNFSSGGKECGCGDQPGFTRTIFGRVFQNRCHSPLMFTDPDADTLVNVEKLILLLK